MKHLPKHLRPRWRYLAVSVESTPDAEIDRATFQRQLWYAAQNLVGDAGSADVDLSVLSFTFEAGDGEAIVRVRRGEVDRGRAIVASLAQIDDAAVGARSRAIAAAVGSYFVLVLLFVVPGLSVFMIAQWVHRTLLGFEANLDLYNAVTYVSPLTAYRKGTNMFLPEEMEQRVFQRAADASGDLPVYLSEEVSLLVFAVWLVVPLVVGYLRFQGADLQ